MHHVRIIAAAIFISLLCVALTACLPEEQPEPANAGPQPTRLIDMLNASEDPRITIVRDECESQGKKLAIRIDNGAEILVCQ